MDTTRRKVMFVGAAVLLLLGAVLIAFYSGSREPSYQGKTLSDWIVLADQNVRDADATTQAAAIRAMGTNIIPYLLEWIQYEEPPAWKNKIDMLWAKHLKQQFFAPQIAYERSRADRAVFAFDVLGLKANIAIPELTRLMNTPTRDYTHIRAAAALGAIGKDALPPLMSMITNKQANARSMAFFAVAKMGTDALPALPVLIQCLEEKDVKVVSSVIVALGMFKQPTIVVPSLTNFVIHSEMNLRVVSAQVLGECGSEARLAIPFLQMILNDPAYIVRQNATNALLKIAPEALTYAPTR